MIDTKQSFGQDTLATIKAPVGGPSTSSQPDDAAIRDRRLAVLLEARGHLVARCYVAAERLTEGWKPWSVNDIDALVHVGDAIAVLDKLVKEIVEQPAEVRACDTDRFAEPDNRGPMAEATPDAPLL